jgi:hypothetical protein
MAGPVPAIHVFLQLPQGVDAWMPGSSPGMTEYVVDSAGTPNTRDLYGRSILHVVGSTVCGVSILAASFQPQPVFSSSNGSFSVRSPSEEM